MKKSPLFLVVPIVGMFLFACGSTTPTQSTFKTNFSLNSIIEANKQYLLEETRTSSGSEVGPSEPFIQNHEEMIVQIAPDNLSAFMEAARASVEQSLLENEARIEGTELDGNQHFSFSYTENGLYGTVHMWGIPGKETDCTLILLITED